MSSFFIFFNAILLNFFVLKGFSAFSFAADKSFVFITPEICQALLREKDVAYQPDVDSRGNPLVPVEAKSSSDIFINKIAIPLEVLLPPTNPFRKKAQLGEVTFDLNTFQILLDNKPFPEKQKDILRKACFRAGYK